MSKDPAFLFYPGDWLGGTLGMSFEEKGAYMEVLMMQFNRGHMTEHMIRHVIGHHWDTIKVKFSQDGEGLWYNERLEVEKEKRKNFVNSRKNNIKGENQYTKKKKEGGYMNGHMTSHMENRNENVINNINEEYFKNSEQAWKEWQNDSVLVEELIRIVSMWGFKAVTDVHIGKAIQRFLTIEFDKEKDKKDLKSHLKRWVNRNAKDVHTY